MLDSLIEPQLASNQPLLVQWKSAKRYGGRTAHITMPVVDSAANAPLAPDSFTAALTPASPAPSTDSPNSASATSTASATTASAESAAPTG